MANTWESLVTDVESWDEHSLESIIFNNFVGGAVIFAYNIESNAIRLIKVNTKVLDSVCVNKSMDEILRDNSWETFNEKNKTIFSETIKRAIKSGREEECETVRHIYSSCGEEDQYMKSFMRAIGKRDNEYLIFSREENVTAEKRAFEEVFESDDKFRHAAEQANVYAWEYFVESREMRPCYRCMRDLGLPAVVKNYPEPAIEMGIFPLDYADMYRDWHKQIAEGATFLEADIPLTPGRVPFHVRYTTEFDENGKPYKAYGSATFIQEDLEKTEAIKARDVAEKKLEDALKVAENERLKAKNANDAKTSFLFNMSHDIRTPMNAIIGFTNLLGENLDNIEKREDYLEKIKESSQVLLSLINNVLEMARIEKGHVQLEEAAADLNEFYNSLHVVFEELMAQKNIAFNCTVNLAHNVVEFDQLKLREVFLNLLSNSYKYTREGGTVDLVVNEIPSSKVGYACVQTVVKDTGIGMSEDFLPHLFEEFSREISTTDSKIEGTGLGMPIVKHFVDLMGGQVVVESQLYKGTTFTVTLYHKVSSEVLAQKQVDVTVSPDDFSGKRILLAEDNDLNAEIAKAILEKVGLEVFRVDNGKVCLDTLKNYPPEYFDLILMDIQMPLMDGYQATKHIRKFENEIIRNMPIIAMTANAFEEDRKNALEAGMNGHLAKPIVRAELYKVLSDYLLKD